MSDFVFNISKGAVAEKFRDGAANGIVLLLKVAETDSAMKDHDTLTALLAGTADEATFTSYARKTGQTGTITVDDTNDRVDVDMADQTWSPAGGASNDTLTDLIIAYQDGSANDNGRVPMICLDFAVTTDGTDLTAQFNASGIYRAS